MVYQTHHEFTGNDLLTNDERHRGTSPDELRRIESHYRNRLLDAAMDVIVQDRLNGDQLPMNYFLKWHDKVFEIRIAEYRCSCGCSH